MQFVWLMTTEIPAAGLEGVHARQGWLNIMCLVDPADTVYSHIVDNVIWDGYDIWDFDYCNIDLKCQFHVLRVHDSYSSFLLAWDTIMDKPAWPSYQKLIITMCCVLNIVHLNEVDFSFQVIYLCCWFHLKELCSLLEYEQLHIFDLLFIYLS